MTRNSNLLTVQKIPIVDLASQYKSIKDEIDKAILGVASSGQYILGKNVEAFEDELARYLNCKYVVSCANGTDAIVLALMALGIGRGDEVITVSHSFFATAEAIALAVAKPVFADIQENDFNIDPTKIEALITKKTKAILPVHLYGQPCEIVSVVEIAKKHGLYVIEDCAQAIGAKFSGKNVGTFGNIGTLSFFPTKNLAAFGDGGAILTNDENIATKIKQLRSHGSPKRYVHNFIGLNSRLDEIQAAILRIKLKYLDEWILKRQEAAKYYNKLFKEYSQVSTPLVKPNCYHVFHQYTIRLDSNERDHVHERLKEFGIETLIYHPIPIHMQEAFSYLKYHSNSLPVTEKICKEILSLPMYPEISPHVQEYIVEKTRNVLDEH